MKKCFTIIAFLFGSVLFFSCKKDKLITYGGDQMLYFSIKQVDSVSLNFSLDPESVKDTIFKIPIGLTGNPLTANTAYDLVVDQELTTAVVNADFELPSQFIFPAGKSMDTLRLKVNRTAKMSNAAYVVALQLKPSPQFNNTLLAPTKQQDKDTKIRIFLTDVLKPTPGWANTPTHFGTEYYLGPFSKKKIMLILQLFENYYSLKQIYGFIDEAYSANAIGNALYGYLLAMQGAGKPVREDDGTLMEVGEYFK